jgi:hypothetical protein
VDVSSTTVRVELCLAWKCSENLTKLAWISKPSLCAAYIFSLEEGAFSPHKPTHSKFYLLSPKNLRFLSRSPSYFHINFHFLTFTRKYSTSQKQFSSIEHYLNFLRFYFLKTFVRSLSKIMKMFFLNLYFSKISANFPNI